MHDGLYARSFHVSELDSLCAAALLPARAALQPMWQRSRRVSTDVAAAAGVQQRFSGWRRIEQRRRFKFKIYMVAASADDQRRRAVYVDGARLSQLQE